MTLTDVNLMHLNEIKEEAEGALSDYTVTWKWEIVDHNDFPELILTVEFPHRKTASISFNLDQNVMIWDEDSTETVSELGIWRMLAFQLAVAK